MFDAKPLINENLGPGTVFPTVQAFIREILAIRDPNSALNHKQKILRPPFARTVGIK